jgi:hypothetical protein
MKVGLRITKAQIESGTFVIDTDDPDYKEYAGKTPAEVAALEQENAEQNPDEYDEVFSESESEPSSIIRVDVVESDETDEPNEDAPQPKTD